MKATHKVKPIGFTIVELMISLIVGAFLLAGVMFMLLAMKITTSDTLHIGELQESGRLAMDVLKRDIELIGFWGSFVSTPHFSVLTHSNPTNPINDCIGFNNDHSFPQPNEQEEQGFKGLFALVSKNQSELNCVSDPNYGSDILQIKHVLGSEVSGNTTSTNKTYFISTPQTARFQKGTGAQIIPPLNGTVWEYIHHVYFIANQHYGLNSKNIKVPTLKRMRLTGSRMSSETIMEGVENLRFIFGLDTDGDARVNIYKPASHMLNSDWQQHGITITNVQIFLLIRTLEADTSNPPTSQTFILGGEGEHKRTLTFNDGFRRKLITSTVRLANLGTDKWAI